MSTFEFSVPTLFGLEGIAGDELRRLDFDNVRVENGRVLFSGDARALAKANICLPCSADMCCKPIFPLYRTSFFRYNG